MIIRLNDNIMIKLIPPKKIDKKSPNKILLVKNKIPQQMKKKITNAKFNFAILFDSANFSLNSYLKACLELNNSHLYLAKLNFFYHDS